MTTDGVELKSMTFKVIMQGQILTQAQLDAIVPVMNLKIDRRMSKAKFEESCIKAMADAGCPLQTETAPVTVS